MDRGPRTRSQHSIFDKLDRDASSMHPMAILEVVTGSWSHHSAASSRLRQTCQQCITRSAQLLGKVPGVHCGSVRAHRQTRDPPTVSFAVVCAIIRAHVDTADQLESVCVHCAENAAAQQPRVVDLRPVRREPRSAPEFHLQALRLLLLDVLNAKRPALAGQPCVSWTHKAMLTLTAAWNAVVTCGLGLSIKRILSVSLNDTGKKYR